MTHASDAAVADLVFHNLDAVLARGRTEDVLGWSSSLFAAHGDPYVMRLGERLAQTGGRVRAGLDALAETLREQPRDARWRTLRAALLRHAGCDEEAVAELGIAFAEEAPDDATLRTFVDLALAARCYARAIAILEELVARAPDRALTRDLLGSFLQLAGRSVEAVPHHERAVRLEPRNADYANNFGTTLRQLGAFAEAEHFLRTALGLHPAHHMAWYNLGNVLRMTRRTVEAIDAYRRSVAIRDDFPEAHFALACALLQAGEWHEGWREWEWRFRSAAIVPPIDVELPPWDGADPRGRRILVVAEQGSGDTLQFARYARALAERGALVTIWAPEETASLLARLPGVLAASPYRARLPEAECFVPMMSLPRLLRLGPGEIPPAPYLAVDAARVAHFARELGPRRTRLRIGVAWAGNPRQGDDGLRSARLAELAALFADADVEWIGVQKGPRAAEIAETGLPIADWSGRLENFDDTAALFANLDGVVSVCTGPVHLAGALGLPTLCLLSTAADWRWGDDAEFTPWYAAMRLVRQGRPGDWHDVALRAAALLRNLALRPAAAAAAAPARGKRRAGAETGRRPAAAKLAATTRFATTPKPERARKAAATPEPAASKKATTRTGATPPKPAAKASAAAKSAPKTAPRSKAGAGKATHARG